MNCPNLINSLHQSDPNSNQKSESNFISNSQLNPLLSQAKIQDESIPVSTNSDSNTHEKVHSPFIEEPYAFTMDQRWTMALLKLLDDVNATDYLFTEILIWAQNAKLKIGRAHV